MAQARVASGGLCSCSYAAPVHRSRAYPVGGTPPAAARARAGDGVRPDDGVSARASRDNGHHNGVGAADTDLYEGYRESVDWDPLKEQHRQARRMVGGERALLQTLRSDGLHVSAWEFGFF